MADFLPAHTPSDESLLSTIEVSDSCEAYAYSIYYSKKESGSSDAFFERLDWAAFERLSVSCEFEQFSNCIIMFLDSDILFLE